MPAWGRSMDDRYLWGMVAFLRQLPGMSAGRYRAAIAASPEHSHGGGDPRAPVPAQEHRDHPLNSSTRVFPDLE